MLNVSWWDRIWKSPRGFDPTFCIATGQIPPVPPQGPPSPAGLFCYSLATNFAPFDLIRQPVESMSCDQIDKRVENKRHTNAHQRSPTLHQTGLKSPPLRHIYFSLILCGYCHLGSGMVAINRPHCTQPRKNLQSIDRRITNGRSITTSGTMPTAQILPRMEQQCI